MKRKSLQSLKYGDPTNDHIGRMKRETPLIQIDHNSLPIPPPPGNDSSRTRSEINYLLRSMKGSSDEDNDFIKISDEKPIEALISFAIQNNLNFDEEYIRDLKKQLSSFVLHLKYRFNRPRPFQVAKELDSKFPGIKSNTANTPAYPSGHAIQAHVLSNVLARVNPGFERNLENFADRIALTRLQMGVHYPSDILMGKEVANMIDPYVLGQNDYRGLALEYDMRKMTREFLYESSDALIKKLRILDFDDTIARTVERVRVETPSGPKMITSKEFAIYDLLPGEYLDPSLAFQEFQSVDVDRASPVPLVSDLLQKFAGPTGTSKLLILTARDQGVKPFVMKFLEERLGIADASNRVDFVGVANKDPMAKVSVIESYLDQNPDIEFVSFYDDSGKNVRAVSDFIKARGLRGDVRQVVEDEYGDVKLVSSDGSVSESIDFRSMTRSFLQLI